MRARFATALGLALTLAGLAGVWMIVRPAPDAGLPAASAPAIAPSGAGRQATPGPPSPIALAPAPRRADAAPAASDWRGMRARFENATNLRAFYYDAVRKPHDGGYFYGNQVLSMCKRALSDPPDDASEARRRAQQALRTRCDFSAQEIEDAWGEFGAIRQLDFNADPLLAHVFSALSALSANDAGAGVAVLNAAIDEGNPDVIATLASNAFERRIREDIDPDLRASPDLASYGQMLLACRLGADCGAQSMRTLNLCALKGWCADSVPDALRIGLGKDFDAIDRLAAQAAAALRGRRLDGLVART